MTDGVLAFRSQFPLLDERRYFASQCLGPLPRDVQYDLDEYSRTLHLRSRSIYPWIEAMVDVTRSIEELLGAAPGSVGLHGSATAAQATLASCLEPRGNRRRIVISTIDFHSSRYLWAGQERRGFELLEIAPADGRGFQPEELAAVLDDRVAAIAIALVSPKTGALLDASRLVDAARRAGALVILDAFQAVGVVPIDVAALDPDVLVGGMYKWMCGGGTGLAFAYVRPDLAAALEPVYPGWLGHRDLGAYSATYAPASGGARFQQGTPAMEPIYTSRAGLRFLREAGIGSLRARSERLTKHLLGRAYERRLDVLTPSHAAGRGSFVCIPMDDAVARDVVASLGAQGIDVDSRPNAGVRIGPHPCCTEEECDRVIDAVALALERTGATTTPTQVSVPRAVSSGTRSALDTSELQRLVTGYAFSASLFTAVELGVFDATATAPMTAADLATRLEVACDPLEHLLELLAVLGLLDRTDAGYRATELARATLVTKASTSLAPVLSHQWKHFYSLFAHLPDAIRTGRPQASRWSFARGEDDGYRAMAHSAPELERFLAAMDRSSAGTGADVVTRVDLTSCRRLVDLGGGGGAVAIELATALPDLALTIVDLDLACAYAERQVRRVGLSERIRCVAGDARDSSWSHEVGDVDVVLLSAVLADWSNEDRMRILRGVHTALGPGGRIVISETLLFDDIPGPVVPAMLSLCLLLASHGASLRPGELRALVSAAGFTEIDVLPAGSTGRSIVLARKAPPVGLDPDGSVCSS